MSDLSFGVVLSLFENAEAVVVSFAANWALSCLINSLELTLLGNLNALFKLFLATCLAASADDEPTAPSSVMEVTVTFNFNDPAPPPFFPRVRYVGGVTSTILIAE